MPTTLFLPKRALTLEHRQTIPIPALDYLNKHTPPLAKLRDTFLTFKDSFLYDWLKDGWRAYLNLSTPGILPSLGTHTLGNLFGLAKIPDKTTVPQFLVTTYTTGSGTHVLQTTTKRLVRIAAGGGAGGAGSSTPHSGAGGGGGGGGGKSWKDESSGLLASYAYSVGAGGAGGAAQADGVDGGDTTIEEMTGNKGLKGRSPANGRSGGAGGSFSGGDSGKAGGIGGAGASNNNGGDGGGGSIGRGGVGSGSSSGGGAAAELVMPGRRIYMWFLVLEATAVRVRRFSPKLGIPEAFTAVVAAVPEELPVLNMQVVPVPVA